MNTIMLVEDHQEIKRLMKILFELAGYRVIATDTYEEILPLLRRFLPDAVLMDVRVQGQETIELVRQLRQSDDGTAHIPIAMTSAQDCRRECLEAGANEFIPKPFLPDEVVEEIASLSGRFQTRQEGSTQETGSEGRWQTFAMPTRVQR